MREIDPSTTNRADAFELWMNAPMPMCTIFNTLDVTNIVKLSKKYNLKFNMLMCWCIGKAASSIDEFYNLPMEDKFLQYGSLAISTSVVTKDGGNSSCDIPYSEDLQYFNQDYIGNTSQVYNTGDMYNLEEEHMVISTSSLTKYKLDGFINAYSGFYNNPLVVWGKYRKCLCKCTLPISFQYHHAQMDAEQATRFTENLQEIIKTLTI